MGKSERDLRRHENWLAAAPVFFAGVALGILVAAAACGHLRSGVASFLSLGGTVSIAASLHAGEHFIANCREWWTGVSDDKDVPMGGFVVYRPGWLWLGVAMIALSAAIQAGD